MLRKHISSEKGQTVVLLALAFIVLLGFTALAIDGGMVYANRRHMQSAADAASLAGASAVAMYLENHFVDTGNWNCSDPRVIKAQINATNGGEITAIKSAAVNDYTIDADISDMNGVDTVCDNGTFNGSWVDYYIDVKTFITSDTPTAFAHFVYDGPLRNTVESVARVRPRTPIAYGNAIVSLGEDCVDGGIEFHGDSDVQIIGGGIFSNSCLDTHGGMSVHVLGGAGTSCKLPNCYNDHGDVGVIDPFPTENAGRSLPKETYAVPVPDCSTLPYRGSYNNGDGTLLPGQYDFITFDNKTHTLEPGLYCVSGDFTINGGTNAGTGVTIYIKNGNFISKGNATTSLVAPPSILCGSPCDLKKAIPGVLIYLADGNTGIVSLRGDGDSDYMGLVYAPDGTIDAGGESSLMAKVHAQMIGKDVMVRGTTTLDITFNHNVTIQLPAKLELNK